MGSDKSYVQNYFIGPKLIPADHPVFITSNIEYQTIKCLALAAYQISRSKAFHDIARNFPFAIFELIVKILKCLEHNSILTTVINHVGPLEDFYFHA